MRPKTLRYASIIGVALIFAALLLPFGNLPWPGGGYIPGESLIGYIVDAGIGVKVAALLLYGGAFLMLFTQRFQTLVLIGGVSFALIAAEYNFRMSSADFGIGMIVLTAGIILATSEIWWKAIAEAFEDDEEPEEIEARDAP